MTMIDAALAALETVCSNVSFVKNEEDPLPDSYVVLSVLDDAPEIYAGDLDEQQHLQVRAAWYTRDLPQKNALCFQRCRVYHRLDRVRLR